MHAYLLTVLGLICFLEGLPYLATPEQVKKMAEAGSFHLSNLSLRILGAALMVAGLLLVYLGRKHGG